MKFRWKVMLCTVCLMSVLFGVGSSLLISLSFSNALDRERSAAQDSYRALLGTLQLAEDMGALRNTRQLSDLLTQLTPREAAAWSGLELTSGEEVILRTGDAVDSMVGSAAAVQEDRNTISYFSDPRGRHYLQLSGCFSVDEQPYILTMAYEISSIYDARASQMRAYWFIFAGMLCVGAVMSYLVSVGLTRPLTRLSTATRAISNGDLSCRAHLKTQDEIGAVGADFDAMAEKMEETVSQLRQSMERQEQFIGSFTHELKTPMTAIIGYADLLRQQTLTPEEQQDAANYIFSEARRLERLSIKLLQIQVGEHTLPELSPVSPASLLEDLAEHLRPGLTAEGISLHVSCGQGVCLLEADLVRSLLINLMDNARKAMPHGGRMSLSGELTQEGCILTVSDTGCGIPAEALAHLTEAFYRVDKARSRAQGGAGLGLTLCARIVELHNGSLLFESVPGQGTRVIAELKGGRSA